MLHILPLPALRSHESCMVTLMDDKTLLRALWNLEREALTMVFEQYAPLVYKYALRTCHSPIEADDVVGEVFSRLVNGLSKGNGPRENLRAYLYQTAYHIIIDNARSRKHYVTQDELLHVILEKDSTADEAEKQHNLRLLQAAIYTNLTEEQKHVIILRFLEGFDLRETAAILGKDINNIKVIQNRALAKLRESFSSAPIEANT